DLNSDVWVGIYGGGISRFNRETEQFEQYLHDENNPASLSSNLILSVFQDRAGNLLAGTYQRGVNIINLEQGNFHSIEGSTGPDGDFSNEVRAVFEDHRGWIWTGNKRGDVVVYNQLFEQVFRLGELPGVSIHTGVYAFEEDNEGNLWIGTKGDGLYIIRNLPGEAGNGPIHAPEVIHVTTRSKKPFTLLHNDVYDLHFDRNGQMWVALYLGGINVIQHPLCEEQRVLSYRHDPSVAATLSDNRVRCFLEDHEGNIWIGTSNGLNVVEQAYGAADEKYFSSIIRPGSHEGITYNDVIALCEDSDSCIWVGTLGGGVNRLIKSGPELTFQIQAFSRDEGLSSNMVLGLAEDSQKNMWISTDFGLNKRSLETGRFESYFTADGLSEYSFSEGNGLRTSSGKLLFGHISGMLWFDPSAIVKSDRTVPVVLTGLKMNGEENRGRFMEARRAWGDSLKCLRFRHNENFLTFEFAALDYKAPSRIQYSYKLEGHEDHWNDQGNLTTVIYRDLPPGDYLFRLRASNSDGIWSNPERQLAFTIQAPPWKTPWAYSLYLVVFLGLFLLLQRLQVERIKLKHEVLLEKQLADDKLKFYTNISHELKTPLTLIQGPVEEMLAGRIKGSSLQTSLKTVQRNSRKLQELIDQLMDFRKIQKGVFQSERATGDLISFLDEIHTAFLPLARQRNMVFGFHHPPGEYVLTLDFLSLEKIVFNLLSNAFKHTPDEKKIMLKLVQGENRDCLIITVEDEGEGIDENDLPQLFKRFHQGKRSRWIDETTTGIGLSLCAELAANMGGVLSAESRLNQGSIFSLRLPGQRIDQDPVAEIPEIHYTRKYIVGMGSNDPLPDKSPKKSGKSASRILIVEDNVEMLQFLTARLSVQYQVLQAANGRIGLEKARKENPDLILCDILMPDMDGLEMTRTLKREFFTSHIPVILLTALSLDEHKIQGLDSGADDYVVKPFNMDFLETRIRNLMQQRKLLQERFRRDSDVKAHSLVEAKPDRDFMEKVEQLIVKKMVEPDFSVDQLLEHFSFGRTVFYKKVKGITGHAPNDFIRIVRMKKAGELLCQNGHSIMEVAFEVGYNDPDYFRIQFKKYYGITPSEYQRIQRAGDEPAGH
ncbi:MAG TPA: two-component regulator propeller domain-containing protein, partial [Prolixibacteraceae bacterium]|nr:two-component regulator propeller domain-containing protein [Prolixibacteraceae bacterium]